MRSSTIISILVALVVAVAAAVLSLTYLQNERDAAMRSAQDHIAAQQPKMMVVVAAQSIEFGERLSAEKLTTVAWYAEQVPDGIFTDINELLPPDEAENSARHAKGSFQEGEPIHQSRVTKAGETAKLSAAIRPGYKAISIRVNDVLGVAGFVLPGDHVDILLTRKEKSHAYVDVLLQSVKVLAIDQLADDRTDQPSVVRTVTFEVDTRAAQRLTLGASVGVLSLALRNIESNVAEANQRISMNLLRTSSNQVQPTNPKKTTSKSKAKKAVAKSSSRSKVTKPAAVQPKPISKPARSISYDTVSVIRGRGERQEYKVINSLSVPSQ